MTKNNEAQEILTQIGRAPEWCARHRVGSALRGRHTGRLYESMGAPTLVKSLITIMVRPLHGGEAEAVHVADLLPVDHLSALGEQGE